MKTTQKIITDKLVYTLKRFKRQKRINVHVRQDGDILVTAPFRCAQSTIDQMVHDHAAWILQKKKQKKGVGKNVTISVEVIAHCKAYIRPVIIERLEYFKEYYDVTYGRVSIRRQKTRWGSCSSHGNLNFNVRMTCLSQDLRDYVIVHELCHLREMNHSPAFWQLVGRVIPDYKERRRALKEFSLS